MSLGTFCTQPATRAGLKKEPLQRACKGLEKELHFFAGRERRRRRGGRRYIPGVPQTLSWQDWQCPKSVCGCPCISARALFEVLGTLRPDCGLTLKLTSGYMPRAYPPRREEGRRPWRAGRRSFARFFPNLADCKILVPQQQAGAEYGGISRPRNGRPNLRRANSRA